jgi:hypothetical protein
MRLLSPNSSSSFVINILFCDNWCLWAANPLKFWCNLFGWLKFVHFAMLGAPNWNHCPGIDVIPHASHPFFETIHLISGYANICHQHSINNRRVVSFWHMYGLQFCWWTLFIFEVHYFNILRLRMTPWWELLVHSFFLISENTWN